VKRINKTQQNLFDNIEPYKLHRKNDPQTSKDASKTVNSGSDRAELLEAIQQAEIKGLTLKEYCTHRGCRMRQQETAGVVSLRSLDIYSIRVISVIGQELYDI